MSVPPVQFSNINWAAAAVGTVARAWEPGTIVSGERIGLDESLRMLVKINGLTVETESPSNGNIPQQFQARVLTGGARPVLEILTPPASSITASAVRARLSQQDSLQPLLADLRALTQSSGTRALPEPVRAALLQLDAAISDQHELLNPATLRNAVQRSGLQLENTLLHIAQSSTTSNTQAIDYDLKAALQRLSQALQQTMPSMPAWPKSLPQSLLSLIKAGVYGLQPSPSAAPSANSPNPLPTPTTSYSLPPTLRAGSDTPPPLLQLPLQPQERAPLPSAQTPIELVSGMLKHVQAALSRIEIMQLEAHPSNAPIACPVEIPIRDRHGFDVLQLRIEPDAESAEAEEVSRWTLHFALNPPSLGPLHGQIRLHDRIVNIDLWAERQPTLGALEEQTTVLPKLLEGSGLRLQKLRIRQGAPQFPGLSGRAVFETMA